MSFFNSKYSILLFLLVAYLPLRGQTFGGGSGTADDPFLITSQEDFDQISSSTNDFTGVHFRQTCDLRLIDTYRDYEPLTGIFDGHYDGGGHSIYMQSVDTTSYYNSVFYTIYNHALVENLIIEGDSMSATDLKSWYVVKR